MAHLRDLHAQLQENRTQDEIVRLANQLHKHLERPVLHNHTRWALQDLRTAITSKID